MPSDNYGLFTRNIGLKIWQVQFFIADKKEKLASKQAGMIRTELGKRLDLIDNEYVSVGGKGSGNMA